MATITDLELAKKHLNIDDYYTGDDDYITTLIRDAEAIVSSSIVVPDLSTLDDNDKVIAKRAVLLLVGEYYAHRENLVVGASVNKIPDGVERLCNLIRNYGG